MKVKPGIMPVEFRDWVDARNEELRLKYPYGRFLYFSTHSFASLLPDTPLVEMWLSSLTEHEKMRLIERGVLEE